MSDRGKLQVAGLDRLHGLDLGLFPIAEDFAIRLIHDEAGSMIRFLASGVGAVIGFPWWENPREQISGWSLADVPTGSIESPYWDMDQGWHILIWQTGDLVYIAQGGSSEGEYDDWFAVPAALYRSEWEEAIRRASSEGS
ncbi:hypothetical protein [Kitasatospora kifunensis]|uniref:SMI1/KNR4 family protein n=1 Tax=Kitasatospora kifunensis TaxID=58351 RepID=A0A7W7R5J4_KITKI|nr:hypothetical protein [Kitasatospora kifunensis]MBB4925818.1 hypothetical protein [Kitasatospora kifunensis]